MIEVQRRLYTGGAATEGVPPAQSVARTIEHGIYSMFPQRGEISPLVEFLRILGGKFVE